jgi:hypothetical protein
VKPGEFLYIKLSAEGSRALSENREDGREIPGRGDPLWLPSEDKVETKDDIVTSLEIERLTIVMFRCLIPPFPL